MNKQKFFRCEICGNFVGMIDDAGIPMSCCNEEMKELVPNTTEAATEKHVPEVTVEGDLVTVRVGSVLHPMVEAHHIEFIYLQTEKGGQRKRLDVDADPIAVFNIVDDTLLEVYEYCNLHGLWKKDMTVDI